MVIKFNLKRIVALFVSLSLMFMSIFRNGNLNLLYFVIPIVFLLSFRENKKNINKVWIWMIPFLLIFLITSFFSPLFNDYSKSLIYLLKIFLCLCGMFSIETLDSKINFSDVVEILSILILLMTIVALALPNSDLWRNKDVINYYSQSRLQLFFLEPSELSEVCGILIISNIYLSKVQKSDKKKRALYFLLLLIPLILSAGLSGIVYSLIAILFFLLSIEFQHIINGRSSVYIIFGFLIAVIVILSYSALDLDVSPIFDRISSVLNGNDSSFNYRYTMAAELLKVIWNKTNFIGVGLGNLRTEKVTSYLLQFNGAYTKNGFANSYMFFMAEGGLISSIIIVYLIVVIIKSIYSSNADLITKKFKMSLLLFLILVQIAGGYFTDPFIWVMYGVIRGYTGENDSEERICCEAV